jgi:hypothetical protein
MIRLNLSFVGQNKSSRGLMLDSTGSLYCHKIRARRRDCNRGCVMKPQRTWNPVGADKATAEIELLYSELAAFNQRIAELEKLHPDGPKIEVLKASALLVSRQIDELRCLSATEELTDLLAK